MKVSNLCILKSDLVKCEHDENLDNFKLQKTNNGKFFSNIQDRKRLQNKHACMRYRDSKKKEEINGRNEEVELLSRNKSLKRKVSALEKEKSFLLEMYAKVSGVTINESMATQKPQEEIAKANPRRLRGRPRVERCGDDYVRKKLGRPKVERSQPVDLEGLDKYQRMRALNNLASKRCRDSRQTKEIFEEN